MDEWIYFPLFLFFLIGGLICADLGVKALYNMPKKPDPNNPFKWGEAASSVVIWWFFSGWCAFFVGGLAGYLIGFAVGGGR